MQKLIKSCVSERKSWFFAVVRQVFENIRQVAAIFAAGFLILFVSRASGGPLDEGYVAHEWGTFTAFQRANGELLEWHPLESSSLPNFVFDWSKPGMNRRCTSGLGSSKAQILTLQRMETPVIYFYAKEPRSVDVEVQFPQGLITEWYPQASEVGPAMVPPPWLIGKLDELTTKVIARPGFSFGSLLKTPAASDSRIHWAHVNIAPKTASDAPELPRKVSGSHYFTARDTDANLLWVRNAGGTNSSSEYEKFLFYRGVGTFETPLRISSNSKGKWVLSNTGTNVISDIFLLNVENGNGSYKRIQGLGSNQSQTVKESTEGELQPLAAQCQKLSAEMEASLVRNGLYPREAAAMVRTWRESWMQEPGVRALYILPRAWTDKVLPLRLKPAPSELVRVMVGRAELLPSETETRISRNVAALDQGTAGTEQALVQTLTNLGRFAEPALRVATENASAEQKRRAWELLRVAAVANRQDSGRFTAR